MKRKTYCITFCLSFFTLLFIAAPILSCSAEANRTAWLLLKVDDANARTIFAADVEKENMSYTLSGFLEGDENHEIKHWNTYSDMTGDNEIKVSAGNWTFTLDAELDNTALYSETISKEIIEGENSITFALSEVSGSLTNGEGSIEVTLAYPTEAGVSKIEAKLISAADYESLDYDELVFIDSKTFNVTVEDDLISYSKTEIPSGVYVLQFNFYKSDDSELQPDYSEAVQVKNGRTSKKSITIETLEAHSPDSVPDTPYEFKYTGQSYWDFDVNAEGRDFIINISSTNFSNGLVDTRDLISFYHELKRKESIKSISVNFVDANKIKLKGSLTVYDNLADLKEIIYGCDDDNLPSITFSLYGNNDNLYGTGMSKIIDKYILASALDKFKGKFKEGLFFDAKDLMTNPPQELLNDSTYSKAGRMYTGDEYNKNAFLLDINTALVFGELVPIRNCSIGYKLLNPTNHIDRSAILQEESIFVENKKLGPLTNVRIKIDASELEITGADGVLEFMDKPPYDLPAGSDNLKIIFHKIGGSHEMADTSYNIDLSNVPESELSLWPSFGNVMGTSLTIPYAGYPTGRYFEHVFVGRDEVPSNFTAENFEKIGNEDFDAEPIAN